MITIATTIILIKILIASSFNIADITYSKTTHKEVVVVAVNKYCNFMLHA